MATETQERTDGSFVYLAGLLTGGLMAGYGIRSLYWSFGLENSCLNCDFATVGFSAVDNISLLPAGFYSIGLIVAGVVIMAVLNSFAWRYTEGGY